MTNEKEINALRRQHARLTADIRYWESRFGAEAQRKLFDLINQRATIKAKLDAMAARDTP